ncbi:MAG: DNA replication/repair protein RecF [Rhizobiaceae bacterium]
MPQPRSDPEQDGPPPRVVVRRLQLSNFRNYERLDIRLGDGPVVLTGENGAGKTNLLEAVSLLTPGRGLRRAVLADVARTGSTGGFAIHATLDGPMGEAEIGTGTTSPDGTEGARRVRINGANARSVDALLEWLRVVWITPAMDGLFTGPAGDRRRFLDRLVLAIDPGHARRAVDYEKAMRGRNKLLSDNAGDGAWFDSIEATMAETGTAIAAARLELVRLLVGTIGGIGDGGAFPAAAITLAGTLEAIAGEMPASDVEDQFRGILRDARHRDRAAGRTLEGPHRSDLLIRHAPKDMPAAQCSTGEQKALLVGLILAHARLTGEMSGMAPVLLLDEIAAHLDANRRRALFDLIDGLNVQSFMTGTDRSLFCDIDAGGSFFSVSNGTVVTENAS